MQDANWNVTALINASGTVVERFEYDIFGTFSVTDGSWAGRSSSNYAWTYLFQGLAYDTVTGLYAARYRDLHPTLGRPLQRDPLGYGAGDANVYRWEENTPVNATDPSGMMIAYPDCSPLAIDAVPTDLPRKPVKWADTRNFWERNLFDPFANNFSGTIPPPPPVVEYIPFIGDAWNIFHHQSIGEDGSAAIAAGGLALDLVTMGGGSLLKIPGKLIFRKGVQEAGEKTVQKVAKEGAEQGIKKAEKCTGKGGRPCFAAGTPIRTRDGWKPIEQFKAGEFLLSRDEHDPEGPIVEQEITEVFARVSPITVLRVGHQEIRTTAEHPFYARERGWIPVAMLASGEWLMTSDGNWVVIESIEVTGEVTTVYNFEVKEYHTYFVGADEWGYELWTHNHNIDKNALDGKARELRVLKKLQGLLKGASIQAERLLRNSSGKKVVDKAGSGRRIDFAVIKNGKVLYLIEVTSKTASKLPQSVKEQFIRDVGGVFIRDKITRKLLDVSGVPTKIIKIR